MLFTRRPIGRKYRGSPIYLANNLGIKKQKLKPWGAIIASVLRALQDGQLLM